MQREFREFTQFRGPPEHGQSRVSRNYKQPENLEDVNRADSKNFTVCSKLESPENHANVDSKDFRENGDFREL